MKIDYLLLNLLIYVSIHRLAGKNFINKGTDSTIILASNQSLCFKNIIAEIESFCMVKLSQKEKDVFNLFFFFFSDSMIQQKVDVIKYLEEKSNKDYKKFLKLVEMIISYNERHDIESSYLKLELSVEFYKLYVAKQNNFSFEYFSTPPNYLSNRLQELYDLNYGIVAEWNEIINYNKFNEYEVCRMTQIITHILSSVYPKKNILFTFKGDGVYEKLAYTTLKDNFGTSVNIHRKPDSKTKYDLVITNYKDADFIDVPALFVSRNFKPKDIDYINHLLFN